MNRKTLTTSTLAIAAALFIVVNILGNQLFRETRFDLTENRLYTLSQGTRNILASIDEPITLKLYLSRKLANELPVIGTYAMRVQEMLEEYARLAGGKLKVQVIDPEPFSEEEDRAVAHGIQGVPMDNGTRTFYFGLVGINSTDDQATIPFFQTSREAFLEYDLTKLIYRLDHPEAKVVGVISTLPFLGSGHGDFTQPPQPAWVMAEQIQQTFDLRRLDLDLEKIPREIDVLMVIHPKPDELPERTRYAIDQFVMRGGNLLLFVDPWSEVETPKGPESRNPMATLQLKRESGLPRLLEAWGIEMEKGKVAADLQGAKRVRTTDKDGRTMVIDYPVWLDLTADNFNRDDVVTGELPSMVVASAGVLKRKGEVENDFTPLLITSDQAMEVSTSLLGLFADPLKLLDDYRPGGEPLVLAARVRGQFSSAFPDGLPKGKNPPAGEKNEETEGDAPKEERPAHLASAEQEANIIVVADTDLLADRFWVRVQNFLGSRIGVPLASNDAFVVNALDNLTGSSDLISVRSRGKVSRPFTRVEALQQEAELRFREKERQLEQRLQETERKIAALQEQKPGKNALILSEEQKAEIEGFLQEKIRIRKELREVQHQLRKEIEALEARIEFVNIVLLPLLIGIGGVAVALYRRNRRHAARSVHE